MTQEEILQRITANGAISLIEDLVMKNFYGELLMKFEAGHIVICKKTESIKFNVPVSKKSS